MGVRNLGGAPSYSVRRCWTPIGGSSPARLHSARCRPPANGRRGGPDAPKDDSSAVCSTASSRSRPRRSRCPRALRWRDLLLGGGRCPTPTIWYDLHALRLAGILDRIAGMVIGTPTDMEIAEGPDTLREIVLDVLGDRDMPVLGTSTSATARRTSRSRSASGPSSMRTPEHSRSSRAPSWAAPSQAKPSLPLAAARAADLVGVVVRVAGVDAQPVVDRVHAGVRVGAGALPLRVGQ